MPLSAQLIPSAPTVRSDLGHFVQTTTAIRFAIGPDLGDYRLESAVQVLWLSCCLDHRLDSKRKRALTEARTESTCVDQIVRQSSTPVIDGNVFNLIATL